MVQQGKKVSVPTAYLRALPKYIGIRNVPQHCSGRSPDGLWELALGLPQLCRKMMKQLLVEFACTPGTAVGTNVSGTICPGLLTTSFALR